MSARLSAQIPPRPLRSSRKVFACSSSPRWAIPRTGSSAATSTGVTAPRCCCFTDRPAAGGYASVSMVDIAYLGFEDNSVDLTTLPLAERRGLLDAPSWPFDGMNEAGVAVGMAAVPSGSQSAADERHDPGKPTIDSLEVMRAILDRAGSVDEAVAILGQYNVDWEGGPPLHYLVADRSGRAALVEFHGGADHRPAQRRPLACGHQLHAQRGRGRCRGAMPALRHPRPAAERRGRQARPRDALDLLQAVAQTESATQWSVVYGMSTGQVDVVMGRGYSQVHMFRLEDDAEDRPFGRCAVVQATRRSQRGER